MSTANIPPLIATAIHTRRRFPIDEAQLSAEQRGRIDSLHGQLPPLFRFTGLKGQAGLQHRRSGPSHRDKGRDTTLP